MKPPTLQQSGIRPPIPTPVEPLEKADGLRVKNRYGEFFFDRRPDGWYMTAPFAAKANDKLISGLLRKMQTFQFGLVVSSSSETHARDKVSGKQAIEVEILHQKRTLWHFYLGKSSEYTLFRAENSNDVWQISGRHAAVVRAGRNGKDTAGNCGQKRERCSPVGVFSVPMAANLPVLPSKGKNGK